MRREGLRRRAAIGVLALALLALAVALAARANDARPGSPGDDGAMGAVPSTGLEALLAEAPVEGEVRELIGAMAPEGAGRSGHASELPVTEEAERVLDGYAAEGDCVVAQSGWLDLLGRTWGCVIQGEGWVDVCVVSEREGGGSEVGVMRMDASDLHGEGG